jgi:hypothetical protein
MKTPSEQSGRDSPSSAEEREARLRIEAYLASVYDDPLRDERPLSVRGACKQLGMSPNTLYKYNLEERLAAAAAYRNGERKKARIGKNSHSEKALDRLRAERDEWRQKYDALLETFTHLKYSIQMEPGIDIERVLARRLPKAVRNAPGKGRRNSRRDQPR